MSAPRKPQRNPKKSQEERRLIHVDLDTEGAKPLTKAKRLQRQSIEAAKDHIKTLKGQRGRDDFWFFIHNIWGPRHPGYNKLTSPCHKLMARHFQDMIMEWEWLREEHAAGRREGYVVRYAQEAARGLGKSLIWTIAGSGWVQARNPDASLVIDTRTERLGIDFLEPIAAVMKDEDSTSDFVEFYGTHFSKERTWHSKAIVHGKRQNMAQIEASFEISANTVSQTSHHPDGVLTDDPINEDDVSENTIGQAIRHKRSWPNIIRVPGFHGYSGTPYAAEDVIGYMKEKETDGSPGSWQWIRIPALEWSTEHQREESVAPQIRPTSWLLQKRKEDPVNFAAQFMLQPGEGEHTPLTLQQAAQLLIRAQDIPTAGWTTIHVDIAWANTRRTKKGDDTVIIVAWNTPLISIIVDIWVKNHCKQEDYFRQLTQMVKQLGLGPRIPMLITMDSDTGGSGGAMESLHRREFYEKGAYFPRAVYINRQQQVSKENRILQAAGQWASGRIRILDSVPHRDKLFFQMTHIGASGHDDVADCAADIFHPQVKIVSPFRSHDPMFDFSDAALDDGWPRQASVPALPSGHSLDPLDQNYDATSLEVPRHDIDAMIAELMREDTF